jgi:hypothetical protein
MCDVFTCKYACMYACLSAYLLTYVKFVLCAHMPECMHIGRSCGRNFNLGDFLEREKRENYLVTAFCGTEIIELNLFRLALSDVLRWMLHLIFTAEGAW